MDTGAERKLLRGEEFERRYGLKWRAALRLYRSGLIRLVRFGRRRYADPDYFDRFIETGGQEFAGGWRKEPKSR
jgi:hypothetical protein